MALKSVIAIVFLAGAFIASYATPRSLAHQSTHVLKNITLPSQMGNWVGEDIKEEENPGQGLLAYIGEMRTKLYVDTRDNGIYMMLMDAGNFHNLKLCFTGSGYVPLDMPQTRLQAGKTSFSAPTVFFRKKGEDVLVIYWMSMDQKLVNWMEQKTKRFMYTLVGSRKPALMVQLDIPTDEAHLKQSVAAAQDFIKTLGPRLPDEQYPYLFGK